MAPTLPRPTDRRSDEVRARLPARPDVTADAGGAMRRRPYRRRDVVAPDVPHHHARRRGARRVRWRRLRRTPTTTAADAGTTPTTDAARPAVRRQARLHDRAALPPGGAGAGCAAAADQPVDQRRRPGAGRPADARRRRCVDIDGSRSANGSRRRGATPCRPRTTTSARRSRRPASTSCVVDGGPPEGASFDVAEPGSVTVPSPGDPLPPFDTPTTDDAAASIRSARANPDICPFHDDHADRGVGRRQAGRLLRRARRRSADTGSCAPGLESIIEVQPEFGDAFSFVHAEVYTDMTGDDAGAGGRVTRGARACSTNRCCSSPTRPAWWSNGIDAVWNTEELIEAPEPGGQLKLWPHPHVREAFGFVMANPDWSRPSL